MAEAEYSCRAGRLSPVATFRLGPDALHWRQGNRAGQVPYAAIRGGEIYKIRFLGRATTYWRCSLDTGSGRPLRLQAAHRLGFRGIENRTGTYIPFIKELEARIAAANPAARFVAGRHWLVRFESLAGAALVLAMRATTHLPPAWSGAIGARVMRAIGPCLRGQRIARANLLAAFPGKASAEIEAILSGMWDNLGRVLAEYGHLPALWDFDPDRAQPGRIVLDEESRRRVLVLRDTAGPMLVFGAHLANWELLSWAAGSRRGRAAIVYRAPRIAPLARELARIRRRSGALLIPADSQTLLRAKAELEAGAALGMLVDEHHSRGIEVEFFGRTCKVNPALAQFARRLECPIHGVRIVRLPGARFRLDVTEAIDPPRDRAGRIDVAATMQAITSIIEGWVREHPEQWPWLQRRWR
jgi:KDO2-lipid IV(A) lauroyltransferase